MGEGGLYAHLKSHRRNVVNILMEVLCSIFCIIISAVHSDKGKTQVVCWGEWMYCNSGSKLLYLTLSD